MPITGFWCKLELYVIFVRGFIAEDLFIRFCALLLPSGHISLPVSIALLGGLSTIAHLVMARREGSSKRMLFVVVKRFGSAMIIRQKISLFYIANIAVSSRTHYVHLSINDLGEVALQPKIELFY